MKSKDELDRQIDDMWEQAALAVSETDGPNAYEYERLVAAKFDRLCAEAGI